MCRFQLLSGHTSPDWRGWSRVTTINSCPLALASWPVPAPAVVSIWGPKLKKNTFCKNGSLLYLLVYYIVIRLKLKDIQIESTVPSVNVYHFSSNCQNSPEPQNAIQKFSPPWEIGHNSTTNQRAWISKSGDAVVTLTQIRELFNLLHIWRILPVFGNLR